MQQNVARTLVMAQHGCVLEQGRIVQSGDRDELLGSDRIREPYLAEDEVGRRKVASGARQRGGVGRVDTSPAGRRCWCNRLLTALERDVERVGWLGTGRMGFELALRLLNAGHDLSVWNRTREKAEPLASLGATIVDRPVDLADRDLVFTIVSSSEVFTEVMLGDAGLLAGDGRTPDLVVDSSTISAEASEQVREVGERVGTELLAAPVSGSPKVVRSGRLGVVASGDRAAFERAEPYLRCFGDTVTYVGEGDRARLVKICHNLILGAVTQVLAETTVLAEKAGIDRTDYLEFINGSVMGSVFSRYKTPGLVNLDYTPTFTGHLLRKDFELGLAAARDLDAPLPLSAGVHQRILEMIGNGFGEEDFSRLLEMAARGAGLKLVSEQCDAVPDGLQPPIDDLSERRAQ